MSDSKCTPCIKAKADKLIANKATTWAEADREFLEGLTEDQLDKMVPVQSAEAAEAPKTQSESKPLTKDQVMEVLNSMEPKDRFSWLPADAQEQIQTGLRIHQQQKESMIKLIKDNTEEGVWSDDELKAMKFETLEKVVKSLKVQKEAESSFGFYIAPTEPKVHAEKVEPMIWPGSVTAKNV